MPVVEHIIRFLILPVLLSSAWDVGVITDDDVQILQNGKFITFANDHVSELVSGSYDPVRAEVYVSDSNHLNASLFKVSVLSSSGSNFSPVVSKQSAIIKGIVFDPATSSLFWTTGNGRTIHSLTVDHSIRSKQVETGNVIHEFKVEIPLGIAVDSCQQYLYWTNCNLLKPTIERSKTDGSGREVILSENLFQPLGIVIDQQMRKMYWSDEREGIYYSIESCDLDGKNREILVHGTHHQPVSLSIAGDKIYWIDWVEQMLWSIPKDSRGGKESEPVHHFKSKTPINVISNTLYLNTDLKDCPALARYKDRIEKNYINSQSLVVKDSAHRPTSIVIDENNPVHAQSSDFCLNNGTFSDNGVCKCEKNFRGARCEISICLNYCVYGTCEVNSLGEATCNCPIGKSGLRCETDQCHGFCMNGGVCSLNERAQTTCNCMSGFSGDRCELRSSEINELCDIYCDRNNPHYKGYQSSNHDVTSNTVKKTSSPVLDFCKCSEKQVSTASDRYERLAVNEENQNQDLVSKFSGKYVIMTTVLGVACILLFVTVILLATKVHTLRKRPRIKKRIVVNKPLAPITCRPQSPEQCEITIENCCNMNICETPCFEPDFRTSKATFSKSKSDDKKMLISSTYSQSSQDEDNY